MATRETFLAKFTDSGIPETALPVFDFLPIDTPLVPTFFQQVENVGGKVGTGSTLVELQQQVDGFIAEGKQVLSLVDGVVGNRFASDITNPHQLNDIDYTIASSKIAVVDNGSVWLSSHDLPERNCIFICQHLIVVTTPKAVVGTIADAMVKINNVGGHWGCFVSGPSKTADIEQSLVIGAHGSLSTTVWMITAE